MFILPLSLDTATHTSEHDVKSLIIIEDLQYYIRKLKKDTMEVLNTFLLSSRHHSISLMYIYHTFPECNTTAVSCTFDRSFMDQSTDIVLFRSLHNRKLINVIGSRLFAEQFAEFKQIMNIVDKIYSNLYTHGRNYLVVSVDFRKNLNNLSRIRFDIFGKKLCVRDC